MVGFRCHKSSYQRVITKPWTYQPSSPFYQIFIDFTTYKRRWNGIEMKSIKYRALSQQHLEKGGDNFDAVKKVKWNLMKKGEQREGRSSLKWRNQSTYDEAKPINRMGICCRFRAVAMFRRARGNRHKIHMKGKVIKGKSIKNTQVYQASERIQILNIIFMFVLLFASGSISFTLFVSTETSNVFFY